MDPAARGTTQKPASAARMYDYFLGGIHNFPADQQAAKIIIEQFPCVPAVARANRAFMGRAVRHLVDAGIRQFLDIGSGIPTAGNVHEIAQRTAPDSRVVYVDIDPTAVAASLEILERNDLATALRADLRDPQAIVDHQAVRRLLDFTQPVGLLLVSVLQFVPDDAQAFGSVARLVDALAPGSYLAVSQAASETFQPLHERLTNPDDVYRRQTAVRGKARTRSEVERFFTGLRLLDPGVVYLNDWRPDPGEPAALADDPPCGGCWVGVGRK